MSWIGGLYFRGLDYTVANIEQIHHSNKQYTATCHTKLVSQPLVWEDDQKAVDCTLP